MSFYKENKNEIMTIYLLSQIVGKIKLEYAAQEPQWAHVMLDITSRGFSTGLIKLDDSYFEIQINLMDNAIEIKTEQDMKSIDLEDGKTISQYYKEIVEPSKDLGLAISIQTNPQEMEWKTPFEEDNQHHHYKEDTARKILQWFQFAWDALQEFIAPIRQRKVYPGLFWGTFDVATIVLYNQYEPFPDDSKIIERAAFDEHMVELGFWLGDDNFDYPTFFILPYPFVDTDLKIDETFPEGSYFSPKMAEYLYEIKEDLDQVQSKQAIKFMEASLMKSMEFLKWEDTEYYFKVLKMEKNKERK